MKYARVIGTFVQEVFTPPTGFAIEDCFTPEVVAMFESVPDEVDGGWTKHDDGTFSAPPPPAIPVVAP